MERTVEIELDGDILSFVLEQPDDMNEDDFYESVCDYIFSNINISIL